jgi:hypothetical protein
MAVNESLQVTDEFIQQNLEHAQIKKSHKKGGPYSKNDRDKRRDEVYRLHFEYGYSARKIADLMKVSRHTINGDLDYWYSLVFKNKNIFEPENRIIVYLEKMNIQVTRLRERLDKAKIHSEQMDIERLIFNIKSKIAETNMKLANSAFRIHNLAREWYDVYLKEDNKSKQKWSLYDFASVSDKARKKIQKILDEDRKHVNLSK